VVGVWGSYAKHLCTLGMMKILLMNLCNAFLGIIHKPEEHEKLRVILNAYSMLIDTLPSLPTMIFAV